MLPFRRSTALAALARRSVRGQERGFISLGGSKSSEPAAPSPNEEVSVAEAERLLYAGIRAIGYDHSDAQVMRDSMMWAQLRDNNQGIIKLTSGGLAKSGDGQPTIELDGPTGARINGQQARRVPTAAATLTRATRLTLLAILSRRRPRHSAGDVDGRRRQGRQPRHR
jgi:hypothetical protein